jgi:PAS domain S-box-containing protein
MKSEENYRDVLDSIGDGVYRINTDGYLTFMNKTLCEWLGIPQEQYYNIHFLDLIDADYHDIARKNFQSVMKGVRGIPYELKRTDNNGQVRIVEVYSRPVFEEGKVVGLLGISRDITERKKAEEALWESEERFRRLSDATFEGIVIHDKGNILDFNQAMIQMFGYKHDEVIGKKNIIDFIAPESKELVLHHIKTGYEKPYEVMMQKKDGSTLVMEVAGKTFYYKGKMVRVVALHDLTDRKRVEEALREGEQLFRTLMERSLVGIYVVQDGLFKSANTNAASYAGYTYQDLVGKKSISIVHPKDREIQRKCASDMLKGRRVSPYEFRIIGRTGEIHWIMETVTPIIYEGRPAILGNSMDITEHKQADEALEKREMELEAKAHELEDLNTALRVLLKQREGDRSELEQKVLSNIKLLILPHIEKLKNHVDPQVMSYVNVLESNLKDIVSPFSQNLSAKYLNFTKREVQVANLIKDGKTTKEIAALLDVSDSAVNVYRYHIRRKLDLTKKYNLRSYLSSLA